MHRTESQQSQRTA